LTDVVISPATTDAHGDNVRYRGEKRGSIFADPTRRASIVQQLSANTAGE
jgi:hypothetical protein